MPDIWDDSLTRDWSQEDLDSIWCWWWTPSSGKMQVSLKGDDRVETVWTITT